MRHRAPPLTRSQCSHTRLKSPQRPLPVHLALLPRVLLLLALLPRVQCFLVWSFPAQLRPQLGASLLRTVQECPALRILADLKVQRLSAAPRQVSLRHRPSVRQQLLTQCCRHCCPHRTLLHQPRPVLLSPRHYTLLFSLHPPPLKYCLPQALRPLPPWSPARS